MWKQILSVLGIAALLGAAPAYSQPKPEPKPVPKPKAPEKGAKWEPPQKVERKAEPVRAAAKVDKWDKGQKKDGFNKAAKGAPSKPSPVGEAKSGSKTGGAAPPPGPSPKR